MGRLSKRLATIAAATMMATGLVLPFGNLPAMAAIGDCPAGEFCWWTNTNYTGPWGHRTWQNIAALPGSCWSMGAAGNSMSSFYNRLTYSTFRLYDGGPGGACSGTNFAIVLNNVANPAVAYDNQVGGVKYTGVG